MISISKQTAKNFLLAKQGLINTYKFFGKEGIMDFFKQAGCIQFDPIDICGRNADLVLFSRIENYDKALLESLLYKEYQLIDQWDKVMSIYPVTDIGHMEPIRSLNAAEYEKHLAGHQDKIDEVKKHLASSPFVNGQMVKLKDEAHFFTWRHKNLGKAILEYLFFKGEVTIHHRQGVKRFFSVSDQLIESKHLLAKHPFKTEADFHKFQLLRRISSVGMLQAQSSDAYLGLYFKTPARKMYLNELVLAGEVLEVEVEPIKEPFYILASDKHFLNAVQREDRVEFLAPLDNLMWDRKMIAKIFDFEYRWEIYHTPQKRKFAPYALPILYNTDFIGQIECVVNRKQKHLEVLNVWYKNQMPTDNVLKLIEKRVEDMAAFNGCKKTNWDQVSIHIYE